MRKRKFKKAVFIVFAWLLVIIIFLSLGSYLLIDSYIGKVNIVEDGSLHFTNSQDEDEPNLLVQKEDTVIQEEGNFVLTGNEELNCDLDDQSVIMEKYNLKDDLGQKENSEISLLEDKIRENLEDNQIEIMEDKEILNILLIGSDTRKAGQAGRSDAIILISINKKNERITATSILRDIYLKIPGRSNNRINSAYAYGGADLLLETIEQNFKLTVDRYITVDFFAFIDIVDIIGGIELEVTDEEIPVINYYISEVNLLNGHDVQPDLLSNTGTQLLNGKQTLAYTRNRDIGNSDFSRSARQRMVLEKIYTKVKNQNIIELSKLLNKLLPQVTTNLAKGELFSLILSLPFYAKYDLQQWSIPEKGSFSDLRINGMAVLGIDFQKNIEELHRRIND